MATHFELSPRSCQPAFPGKVDRQVRSFRSGLADVDGSRFQPSDVRQPIGVSQAGTRPTLAAAGGFSRSVLNEKSRMTESSHPSTAAAAAAVTAASGSQLSPDLIQAYLETEYRVDGAVQSALSASAQAVLGHSDVRFTLKVGQPCDALSALHRDLNVDCSAFITPCNPFSRELSEQENTSRMGEFIDELRQRSLRFVHGSGAHPDSDKAGAWRPEPSVLVLGLSREAARRLGLAWEQNAIVWTGADATPHLVMLR